MILCHKCAGVLASKPDENRVMLRGCECMSGYVRGFEPDVDRATAIQTQIDMQLELAELYERQGRSLTQINSRLAAVAFLETLK